MKRIIEIKKDNGIKRILKRESFKNKV